MKKMLIVLLAGLLMLIAVACKANEAPKEAVKNEEPQEAAQEEIMANEPVAGGWTPAEDFGDITAERRAIFDKGMETLLGVDYAPLAYLGSQVVAGTNHVFLVKGTMVVPAQPVSYALAYFYEDLQGNVKLMNVADLPIVPQADGTLALPEEGVGEQVVAGLNRCLLVQVTPVVPNARPHYALAYIYTDLEGNSSLTQVIDLDVGAYCTYGA